MKTILRHVILILVSGLAHSMAYGSITDPSAHTKGLSDFDRQSLLTPKIQQQVQFACGKDTCHGELWKPITPPHTAAPIVVMAHGFALQYEWGLLPFAEQLVKNGMAVLLFDYRGFGLSTGQPREVVDGTQHVQDYLSAVDFVKTLPDVNTHNIALWGTSYSGGHVLVAAAKLRNDPALRAVVAQVPFVDGISSAFALSAGQLTKATWLATRDTAHQIFNSAPVYIPVVSEQGFAAFNNPEDWLGYRHLIPKNANWPNRVASRIFRTLPLYRPINSVDKIQVPILILAGEKDTLIPIAGTRKAAQQNPKVEYVEFAGATHWTPYVSPLFEQSVQHQVRFLQQHLQQTPQLTQ
ncbi:MAG: alpha/beta fold hydrolase [Pseudomonadota bacterium]|nr:alpha/beta fold hydrolase [Pseudomonadota bacterium]